MAIKVGEVYVEVYPKINAAARKAAIQGIASSFRDEFDKIDKESSKSADKQVKDQERVKRNAKKNVDEQRGYWDRFYDHLQKNNEGVFHKMATRFRTIGTLLRGLSVANAVIGGLRLMTVAVQATIALMPVLQAGLLSIPFLIGAIGVEAGLLGIAFHGVGKAIGLAFDPSKADKFQDTLDTLSPSAKRFVLNIAKAVPILKGLQESLFAAPALQKASARFGTFMRGLQFPLNHLAAVNGNLIGKILGTFTDSKGMRISIAFVNALSKIIRGITPGLQALTRAFQILALKVAVQLGTHIGGVNKVLEKMAAWLAKIDVHTIFEKAILIIQRLKPAAENIKRIFEGISKALGGWKGSSKDFIKSITTFTQKVADFVNSKDGQQFIQDLRDTVSELSSLTSIGLLAGLQLLGDFLGALKGPLKDLHEFAQKNPGQFLFLAITVTILAFAFGHLKETIYAVNLAIIVIRATITATLAIAAVLALPVTVAFGLLVLIILAVIVVIAALAVGIFFLVKYWSTIWGGIMQITVWASRGIQKLIEWMSTFFTKILPRAMEYLYHYTLQVWNWIWGAISTAGKNIIKAALAVGNWFTQSLPHFFYVAYQWVTHWLWAAVQWVEKTFKKYIIAPAEAVGNWFSKSLPHFFWVSYQWITHWLWEACKWVNGTFTKNIIKAATAVGHWFTTSFPHFFYVGYQWVTHWLWAAVQWFNNTFVVNIKKAATAIGNWFSKSWPHFFYVAYQWVTHWFWQAFLWFNNTFVVNFKKIASSLGNWFKTTFVNFFKDGWKKATGIFESAIQGIWRIMKRFANDVFAGPWNWVAKHIFNGGILKAWNAVAGILGLKSFQVHLDDKVHFATGGFVSGPGGPRDDKIPAMLSDGEFVVNAASTKRNLGLLRRINSGGSNQQFADGSVSHFARGGLAGAVWPSIVQFARNIGAMAGLHITSTTGGGHAPHSYHYSGMAVDVAGSAAAMNRAAAKLFQYGRYFLEMFHSPRWFIKNGHKSGPIDYANHFSHIHMAMSRASATAALHGAKPGAFLLGGGGGGIPAIIASIWGFLKKGVTYFSDPIMKLIKAGVKGGGLGPKPGPLEPGHRPGGFVRTVLEKGVPHILSKGASIITSKVGTFIKNALAALASPFTHWLGGKGPSKFNRWFDEATGLIGGTGLDRAGRSIGSYTGNIVSASNSKQWRSGTAYIAKRESGYNPNAINSIRVGHQHAMGLMQMLPSTFNANRSSHPGGIFNPVANLAAAIIYIKRRYGSPQGTPWFHGRNYYEGGGYVRAPRKIFDNGGPLPPGFTMAYNGTGQTEWVGKGNDGTVKELHVHVADEHFVAQIDDRIARHDNDMIQYIITRHH